MEDAKGFEVTEYGKGSDERAKRSAILTAVSRMERDNPTVAIRAKFEGLLMKLTYHSYEMGVASNIKDVTQRANRSLDEALKYIKREYREYYAGDGPPRVDFKELKEKRDHTVQKVSMNERYYVLFWRVYRVE